MRRGIVTGACLMVLMGGAAHAADDQIACEVKLRQAEAFVDHKIEQKLLSEGDVENINMLLDEADALCTEGKYAEAAKTLANVRKMVAAATKPSQQGQ
jgi:hypothetical protein